ncbi:unnamed protein product, partial [Symbiodinium microadriaticum]
PAESAALYASADISGTLQPGECYIVKGSQAYIGPVAVPCSHLARAATAKVWRYPCHGPADVDILHARQPPAGMALPRVSFAGNAMVLSKWGDVNKKWAGGDLDGDLNFASSPVCFLDALVRLIQDTAPYVDAQDFEAMEAEVLSEIHNRKVAFEHADVEARGEEYIKFFLEMKTPRLRGIACRLAERAASRVIDAMLIGDEARVQENLPTALKMIALAHKAMDAPKKYDIDDFIALCRVWKKRAHLMLFLPRVLVVLGKEWSFSTAGVLEQGPPGCMLRKGVVPTSKTVLGALRAFPRLVEPFPEGQPAKKPDWRRLHLEE